MSTLVHTTIHIAYLDVVYVRIELAQWLRQATGVIPGRPLARNH